MKGSSITLSDEQLAVVNDVSRSLVVIASAGAGKTSTLVHRYLKHVVVDGFRPDEILTITFTRRAAAEMKGRIVAELRDRELLGAAQVAETGPIQTIHGFCERTLRENSLEAGLDPQFEILSDGQAKRMIDDCVRTALSDANPDHPWVGSLLQHLAGAQAGSVTGDLTEAIKRTLDAFRPSGVSVDEFAELYATPDSTLRHLHGALASSQLDTEVAAELDPFLGSDEFGSKLKEIASREGIKNPLLSMASPAEVERTIAEHTAGLVNLVCRSWRELEARIAIDQSLDFTALESRAVALVRTSEATRERLRSQYRIAMIDEAQDMNPMQHALLSGIGIDREMLVGDPQQSIYGFREADLHLFEAQIEVKPHKRLTKNYRSQTAILEFVDSVFQQIWESRYAPMAPVGRNDLALGEVELWMHGREDYRAVAETVRKMTQEGLAPKDIALLVRGNKTADILLAELESVAVPARIVGGSTRFYTRLHVRDLANALKSLVDPYNDFALFATLRSPLGGLSLDSIALLARARPAVEALATFEAPVESDRAALTRFLAWFTPLSRTADRMAAWEVIAEIFARSDYLATIARSRDGDQQLANVRKLLAQAVEAEDLGPAEFSDTIRDVQRLRHPAGEAPSVDQAADAVTIMTIHKAKGLEFPVVVLPELHIPVRARERGVLVDPRRRAVVANFSADKSRLAAWLKDLQFDRDWEEQHRLLYVAMTRAQRRLCVCVERNSAPRSMAGVLADKLKLKRGIPAGVTVRNRAE